VEATRLIAVGKVGIRMFDDQSSTLYAYCLGQNRNLDKIKQKNFILAFCVPIEISSYVLQRMTILKLALL